MKDRLVKDLEEAYQRLIKVLELMPDDAKIDKWSKKEIMAHIAGWYEEFGKEAGAVFKILHGEKPLSFKYSIDGYNKRSIIKRMNIGSAEIFEEMKIRHKQIIDMLNELDETQITDCYGTMLRGKPINVLWMVQECIEHDNNHAEELENNFKV